MTPDPNPPGPDQATALANLGWKVQESLGDLGGYGRVWRVQREGPAGRVARLARVVAIDQVNNHRDEFNRLLGVRAVAAVTVRHTELIDGQVVLLFDDLGGPFPRQTKVEAPERLHEAVGPAQSE